MISFTCSFTCRSISSFITVTYRHRGSVRTQIQVEIFGECVIPAKNIGIRVGALFYQSDRVTQGAQFILIAQLDVLSNPEDCRFSPSSNPLPTGSSLALLHRSISITPMTKDLNP
ncbi:hypothetical protein WUBG_05051 [Wuchereria bancrofti]|uniref:Uncharacterized protein n=1 Tax=Wuchereria bancrofti TaxID=6293 RepID=J9F3L6_WUCBA|nr:hypothetical protein WUBG_05051 [Wuchereria bancrofti]